MNSISSAEKKSGQISTQKVVHGCRKHVVKVQLAKRHLTKYKREVIYASDLVCIFSALCGLEKIEIKSSYCFFFSAAICEL